MSTPARWIRLDAGGGAALRAAVAGFAQAQSEYSAPAALWGRAGEGERLLDSNCERELTLALVAPFKFAPGHPQRWCAWALTPLVAAWRAAGLRAYLEGDGVFLSGRRVAAGDASAVGACVVVISSVAAAEGAFLDELRRRIASQHGWQFDHSWPSAAEKEAMLEQADAA